MFTRSSIKIKSLPENDLQIELGRFGIPPQVSENHSGFSSQSLLKHPFAKMPRKTSNRLFEDFIWNKREKPRIKIAVAIVICLAIVLVDSFFYQKSQFKDYGLVTAIAANFSIIFSKRIRNSQKIWTGALIIIAFQTAIELVVALYIAIGNPSNIDFPDSAKDNESLYLEKYLLLPLRPIAVAQLFSISGLPIKRVIAVSSLLFVLCGVQVVIVSDTIFSNGYGQIILYLIYYFFVCTISMYLIFENRGFTEQAYRSKVLAEQSTLSSTCQQEASNQHKLRIVEWIKKEVFDQLIQAQTETEITLNQFSSPQSGPSQPDSPRIVNNQIDNDNNNNNNEFNEENNNNNTFNEQSNQSEVESTVLMQLSQNDSYKSSLRRINRNIVTAQNSLRDTIDLLMIEAGNFVFYYSVVDFTSLLSNICDSIRSKLQEKNIQIVFEIDEELKKLQVRADAVRLCRVIEVFILFLERCTTPDNRITIHSKLINKISTSHPEPTVTIQTVISHSGQCVDRTRNVASFFSSENCEYWLSKAIIEKGHLGKVYSQDNHSHNNSQGAVFSTTTKVTTLQPQEQQPQQQQNLEQLELSETLTAQQSKVFEMIDSHTVRFDLTLVSVALD